MSTGGEGSSTKPVPGRHAVPPCRRMEEFCFLNLLCPRGGGMNSGKEGLKKLSVMLVKVWRWEWGCRDSLLPDVRRPQQAACAVLLFFNVRPCFTSKEINPNLVFSPLW